jgi:hypothetical protein
MTGLPRSSEVVTGCLDIDDMAPAERQREVAAILAAGFLRLKCRRGYIPAEQSESALSGDCLAGKTAPGILPELSGCLRAPTP